MALHGVTWRYTLFRVTGDAVLVDVGCALQRAVGALADPLLASGDDGTTDDARVMDELNSVCDDLGQAALRWAGGREEVKRFGMCCCRAATVTLVLRT